MNRCKNVNFSKRNKCNRCGSDRTVSYIRKPGGEIGKYMSDKSKGLFSPDDWCCKGYVEDLFFD